MKRLLPLLLVVAVAVGLAAWFVPSDAASMNGGSVSRRSLDADLSAIASSTRYQCYLSEQKSLRAGKLVGVQVEGAGQPAGATGVYATSFVDGWLSQMVQAQVADQLLARRGVAVTAGDLTVAKTVLERRITGVLDTFARSAGSTPSCGGSGAAVLASVPAAFVAEQVRAQADQSLLEARAVGAGLTGSQVATYFAAHRGEFDKTCLSVIVVRTKADASLLQVAIAGGASFAQEAKTSSITSTSGAAGGVVGCGVLAGTSLLAPVEHLATGQVSAPISYNGVYLLAEVTARTPSSYTSVQSTVLTVLLLAGQPRANAELAAALRSADVRVDPRFGRLGATTTIDPPSQPPLGAVLSARADTPGSPAAGG